MSTIDNASRLMPTGPAPLAPVTVGTAPPADSSGTSIGAGDIWRVIKQRKLMITILFMLFYMMVVAVTVLVWRFAPAYSSQALVKYVPPSADPYTMQRPVLPKDYITHELATMAAAVKNPEMLIDLLAQEEIKATSFYQSYNGDQEACLQDLKGKLGVAPLRETYLMSVTLALREASEATLIVNTLARRFVDRQRTYDTDERRVKLNALKDQQAEVQQQLEEIRRRIAELRAQRDLPTLEGERSVQTEMIVMLSNTKAELLARQVDLEAQLSTVRGTDPRNLPISAEMRVIIESDPVLRYYRQQVEELDVQLTVYAENVYGKNHPRYKTLQSQRDQLFQKEARRREELIEDLRSRQVESLEQELARLRRVQTEVQEQLSERENLQRDLDSAIQLLSGLQQDEDRINNELETITLKVRENEHQHEVQSREGQLVVAQFARDATRPSRPNFVVYLGGGFLLSLLASVGLALLREFTDKAVRTPVDAARFGRLSVLGAVPELDDEEADIDEVELATRLAPQSLVAEAFRQIRAHLMFSGPAESQRTLLVTSPRAEEGKTASAINLAVTMAQGNERVLIIDTNFRRPGLQAAFPGSGNAGLSNVLVGQTTFDEAVSRTDLPNLDILCSGPMPPNPAELLGSPMMRDMLGVAQQKYDRIIVDGPPSLLVSDALVVATQVDGVVMIARAGITSKGALRRAREQFQRLGVRVIGAVLNGVKARPGGYYREQYREFYEYASEEVIATPELPPADRPVDVDPRDQADSDRS